MEKCRESRRDCKIFNLHLKGSASSREATSLVASTDPINCHQLRPTHESVREKSYLNHNRSAFVLLRFSHVLISSMPTLAFWKLLLLLTKKRTAYGAEDLAHQLEVLRNFAEGPGLGLTEHLITIYHSRSRVSSDFQGHQVCM